MPELPEVETTLRGIAPHLSGRTIADLVIRDSRLRWPIPEGLRDKVRGQCITGLKRRGKYILIQLQAGTLILHLGMSGSLRLTSSDQANKKHDHYDLLLDSGALLRYHDPRRFGCLLWTFDEPERHALLKRLGPEPLEREFQGSVLFERAKRSRIPVKTFIMKGEVVVGVGNIYASESLFRAGILPEREAGQLSKEQFDRLALAIKGVLEASIAQGGTTLRDFVNESGVPGYFKQTLNVYDRAGEPCRYCGELIRSGRMAQRATYWCPSCQA